MGNTDALEIAISYNAGKSVNIPLGKMTFFEEFYVDCQIEKVETKGSVTGQRLKIMLHPKTDFTLQAIDIQLNKTYNSSDKIFCNGYQSSSESREYAVGETIARSHKLLAALKPQTGDDFCADIRREKGYLHSWSYSYIRSKNDFFFLGSLSEKTAFSLIQHDTKAGKLSIHPDCKGLNLAHSFPITDLMFLQGKEKDCMETYFAAAEVKRPLAPPAIGWTSRQYSYTDVSEKNVLENLHAWREKESEKPIFETDFRPKSVFQIEDGWQSAVGDWLSPSAKFPNGMAALASNIKAEGYTPSLCLAPFICEKKSDIFQKNQDWLLKNKKNKPQRVGYSLLAKREFYALDFYNVEVRSYLTKVLQTILLKWGYAILKLDFLFAVCIQSPAGKTRGQVMHDAMSFLRNVAGDKLIMACKVPLASAFGLADYCSTGTDIYSKWEHKLLAFLNDRERPSSLSALRSILGRHHLNGIAFQSAADVFTLSEENNKLNSAQQDTLLKINALVSNIVLTSDRLTAYTPEQTDEFFQVESLMDKSLNTVENLGDDGYKISYTRNGHKYCAYCNLTNAIKPFSHNDKTIRVEAFETIILRL